MYNTVQAQIFCFDQKSKSDYLFIYLFIHPNKSLLSITDCKKYFFLINLAFNIPSLHDMYTPFWPPITVWAVAYSHRVDCPH